MSNHDLNKLISLKLAQLSKTDQRWLMSKLPEQKRQKISEAMKYVKHLGLHESEIGIDEIVNVKQSDDVSENVNFTNIGCSTQLATHLQKVSRGEVNVPKRASLIVNTFLASKANSK